MSTPRCRAQGGPSKCKDPHCPKKRAQFSAFAGEALTARLYSGSKPATKERVPGEIVSTIDLQPQVHISEERITDGYKKWQAVWIKDSKGTPVVYLKLRVGDTKAGNGDVFYSGVVLCSLEVNPKAQGKNATLAAFRVIKEQYGVDHLWVGDTFSSMGYHMLRKLQAHEEVTGEKTLALDPHVRSNEVHADGEERYEFVRDWESMQPMYRL